MPWYWIADPESRTVETYRLVGEAYVPAGSLAVEAVALPPFPDLLLEPAALWS